MSLVSESVTLSKAPKPIDSMHSKDLKDVSLSEDENRGRPQRPVVK